VLARTPPIDDTIMIEPSFLARMPGRQRLTSHMFDRMLFWMIFMNTSSGIFSFGP
jgi:hypothetical protein